MKNWRLLLIPLFILGIAMYIFSIYSFEERFLHRRKERNITFMSGGSSQQERENFEEIGRDYSLKLIFLNKKNQYLSDVKLTILSQKGETILTTVANGPWFFINLPPGVYNFEASFQTDRKRIPQINIEGKDQKVISIQW